MGYGGNGGSYGEATKALTGVLGGPVPTREPVIMRETARLDGTIESLHMAITELESRLSAVLMPEGPGLDNKNAASPHPGVPLGQVIASAADRVHGACARLQTLIARVEV